MKIFNIGADEIVIGLEVYIPENEGEADSPTLVRVAFSKA